MPKSETKNQQLPFCIVGLKNFTFLKRLLLNMLCRLGVKGRSEREGAQPPGPSGERGKSSFPARRDRCSKQGLVVATPRWEFLEHTADIQIRSYGCDLPTLFINAAEGMMDYLFHLQEQAYAPTQYETIQVVAGDKEALLVDWLSELLLRSCTSYQVYCSYAIQSFDEWALIVDVGSSPAHAINDIKAVTYHDLAIRQEQGVWQVTVTYDI